MIFKIEFDKDYDCNTDFAVLLNKISEELRQHKIRLSATHEELICIAYAREYVLKNGIDTLLNLKDSLSTEDVHGKISDVDAKTNVFHEQFKCLDFPEKCESLMIFDPYIFHQKYDTDYELIFITNSNYNTELYSNIKKKIQSKISIKIIDDIHDRFWIVNNSKGILIGTSLNGFGKKYTITNPLKEHDIQDILKIIKNI
jgi:hypothetical protein